MKKLLLVKWIISYLLLITFALIEAHLYQKVTLHGNNIVCYMHGYEYNVFTGKLENMKSWKKDDRWMEQTLAWRHSGDLKTYNIYEKNGKILIEIN